jgi:predicted CoA-binding protein
MKKKTLIIGASPNPDRYSYMATEMLVAYGHEVYPFGLRAGKIGSVHIETIWPIDQSFDTVTLYVGSGNQDVYWQKMIDLKPKRVIFNPGTENSAFFEALNKNGIVAIEACTLVMLRTGQY